MKEASSTILFLLMALLFYGIANPLMTLAQRTGAGLSPIATIFSTSIGGLLVGIIFYLYKGDDGGPLNIPAILLGVIVGVLWTVAMLFWTRVLAPDINASPSIVFTMIGMSPVVAITISLICFKEWSTIIPGRFIAGIVFCFIGLYFVLNCKKPMV